MPFFTDSYTPNFSNLNRILAEHTKPKKEVDVERELAELKSEVNDLKRIVAIIAVLSFIIAVCALVKMIS